jgi:class 3 adenylate cyclase
VSIEAINEQLLRSVGVGVALFSDQDYQLEFSNDVFTSWFSGASEQQPLAILFPELDLSAMQQAFAVDRAYSTELKFRIKRRTLVVAQTFSRTQVGDQVLIVLECQNITRIRELESMIESYSSMVERNAREIQREKEQVEKLLLNIMPRAAYEEYKDFGVVAPQRHQSVSVLVLEFTDFSQQVEALPPATLVSELNELFSAFDKISELLGCERIRTTGDTYRCIAGMQDPEIEHAHAVSKAAVRFVRFLKRRNTSSSIDWQCRVGLGTGSVVGSVVGNQKYVFDVFGQAVDAAMLARAHAGNMEILVQSDSILSYPDDLTTQETSTTAASNAGLIALRET